MILNYIWIAFFLLAILLAAGQWIIGWIETGDWLHSSGVLDAMVQSTFDMSTTGFEIALGLTGALTLWSGIMKIGESGGAIGVISRIFNPFFKKIFPEVPDGHPAQGAILMNFSANMLGLDNAATPLGLKAMNHLQDLNPEKEKASNAQIMFLVLNTSGLTLIPVSIMALRSANGAANPADIFLPILIATFISSLAGLLIVSLIQKINLFQPIVLTYLAAASAFVGGLAWFATHLSSDRIEPFSKLLAALIIFSFIGFFFLLAMKKKINVYDQFIEGAKEGFQVAIRIIPYLVAMLVAIGLFRAAGGMDILINGIKWTFSSFGFYPEFADALPTAMMRPLSGSGSRALMVETWTNPAFGIDSFVGRLASIFQGSTETTFYTVAVYYGAVNIKNTRYTIGAGLLADLAGIVAAIVVAYIFFGH